MDTVVAMIDRRRLRRPVPKSLAYAPRPRPPKVGPLAVRRYDRDRRGYVVRLLPAGVAVAEAHLARYPLPALILYRVDPPLARAALGPAAVRSGLAADAQQAARLGVARAASIFDPARGVVFSSYAVAHIRAAVQVMLRRRVGEPAAVLSGDATGATEDGRPYFGVFAAPDDGGRREDAAHAAAVVRRALRRAGLSRRQREVLALQFGLGDGVPLTQTEVARVLGVSKSAVGQYVDQALAKIRRALPAGV